ncbi:MAG: methyltransferase [Sandaracinaceae bacterium]
MARLDEANVEAALRAFYVTRAETSLRPEEVKKVPQLAGILSVLARTGRDPRLVDAAAGRAPVGLMAAKLLGWTQVVVIERDPGRAASARRAAARVPGIQVEVREGDVADASVWPAAVEVVVALHACGPAFDAVVDQAMARNAPWIVAVPCCYSDAVGFAEVARAWADHLGVAHQAAVRRRFLESLIDTERTLRLEAGGYRVSVQAFVPPSVTPPPAEGPPRRAEPRSAEVTAPERSASRHSGAPPTRTPRQLSHLADQRGRTGWHYGHVQHRRRDNTTSRRNDFRLRHRDDDPESRCPLRARRLPIVPWLSATLVLFVLTIAVDVRGCRDDIERSRYLLAVLRACDGPSTMNGMDAGRLASGRELAGSAASCASYEVAVVTPCPAAAVHARPCVPSAGSSGSSRPARRQRRPLLGDGSLRTAPQWVARPTSRRPGGMSSMCMVREETSFGVARACTSLTATQCSMHPAAIRGERRRRRGRCRRRGR